MLMKKMKIVFWGDSFINRTGVKDAQKPEKLFSTHYVGNFCENVMQSLFIAYPEIDFTFLNMGVSGETTEKLLNNLRQQTELVKSEITVLLIGHNDLKHGDLVNFKRNYIRILDQLSEWETFIIGISILPIENGGLLNDLIVECNDWMAAELYHRQAVYLDICSHFRKILSLNQMGGKIIKLFEETHHLSKLSNAYIGEKVKDEITSWMVRSSVVEST